MAVSVSVSVDRCWLLNQQQILMHTHTTIYSSFRIQLWTFFSAALHLFLVICFTTDSPLWFQFLFVCFWTKAKKTKKWNIMLRVILDTSCNSTQQMKKKWDFNVNNWQMNWNRLFLSRSLIRLRVFSLNAVNSSINVSMNKWTTV